VNPSELRLAARRRAARTVRDLSARCYVDLSHDAGRTVLLCSSGRSGSTWLANLVNHRNEYRLLFEPLRRDRVPAAAGVRYGHYLDPSDEGGEVGRSVHAILRGEVRALWADRYNRARLVRRRLIKEIRATNLMPWIRARYPVLPIVYLLRDPAVVAASFERLGWDDHLSEFLVQDDLMAAVSDQAATIDAVSRTGSPFERHLLRWCLENALPLRLLEAGDAHVVFYEDVVEAPRRELRRLFAYLGTEWDERVLDAVTVPSQTSFADAGGGGLSRTDGRGGDLLGAFGLDWLYGPGSRRCVSPLRVLGRRPPRELRAPARV
jgi:hypothetical protein